MGGQGRIIIHYYDKAQTNVKYFFPTPEKEKGEKWNDWGNKQKVCDNVEFLKKKISGARQKKNEQPFSPWVVQSQLTPTTSDLVKPHKSLRAYAIESNRLITAYWRNDWSDLKSRYIMVDFIKSSNIIEESIKKNIPKRPVTSFIAPLAHSGFS